MYIIINVSDIDKCSKNNIVACWSELNDAPYVEVSDLATSLFPDNQVVEEI